MSFTKVDWLRFRATSEVPDVLAGVRAFFGPLGASVSAKPRNSGLTGFNQSARLLLGDMQVGMLAFGGEHQRGWVQVDISGRGCEWVHDWAEAVDSLGKLDRYEARRVDIALDTGKGEVSHEKVLAAYRAGRFNARGAGRPPKMSQILPERVRDGRTIYVGDRTQGKFLRGYEKGYELLKGNQFADSITHIDGNKVEDMYRLELELKAKDGPLPVDLVERRDEYFSGAYPYLQEVLSVEPEIFSQARERGPQMDLQAALSNIRQQYGSTLFTALTAYHGDIGAVWEKIVGRRHNASLLEAGVLLVDHD